MAHPAVAVAAAVRVELHSTTARMPCTIALLRTFEEDDAPARATRSADCTDGFAQQPQVVNGFSDTVRAGAHQNRSLHSHLMRA